LNFNLSVWRFFCIEVHVVIAQVGMSSSDLERNTTCLSLGTKQKTLEEAIIAKNVRGSRSNVESLGDDDERCSGCLFGVATDSLLARRKDAIDMRDAATVLKLELKFTIVQVVIKLTLFIKRLSNELLLEWSLPSVLV
jgi:hypothetical protein